MSKGGHWPPLLISVLAKVVVLQRFLDESQVIFRGLAERKAQFSVVPSQLRHGGFDRDRIHLAKKHIEEGFQPDLQPTGGLVVSVLTVTGQLPHLLGDEIGSNGNDAFAAQGADGDRLVIIAGPDVKIRGADSASALNGGEVSAGLLGPQNVGVTGEGGIPR